MGVTLRRNVHAVSADCEQASSIELVISRDNAVPVPEAFLASLCQSCHQCHFCPWLGTPDKPTTQTSGRQVCQARSRSEYTSEDFNPCGVVICVAFHSSIIIPTIL